MSSASGRVAPELPVRVEALTPARLAQARRVEGATLSPVWSEATWREELALDDRRWLVALAREGPRPRAGEGSPQLAGEGARAGSDEGARSGSDKGARPGSDEGAVASVAGERLVGLAGLWLGVDEAHVLRVAVDPAWHRRGVGTLLTSALLDTARSAGFERVTLEVRADNVPALRCYEGLGFLTAGRRPGYYPDGQDAVICWWPSLP